MLSMLVRLLRMLNAISLSKTVVHIVWEKTWLMVRQFDKSS